MSNNATVQAISQEGLQFYNTLQAEQGLAFQNNQAALAAVNKMWAPIMNGGSIPYGFSPGLDSLLQSNVISTGTQAETNAMNAEALRMKQESGGANVLPTGASEALNADITAKGQQSIASGLQNEKIAGYKQGVTNLEGATDAELGIAKGNDPNAYAGSAVSAGDMAEKAGAEMFKENQESSTFGKVMGGISSIAGAAQSIGGMAAGFGIGMPLPLPPS